MKAIIYTKYSTFHFEKWRWLSQQAHEKVILLFLMAIVFSITSNGQAKSTAITLVSNGDATVWQAQSSTNYGALDATGAGNYTYSGSTGKAKALVWFDLSTIPANSQIISATFKIYRKTYNGSSSQRNSNIYRVTAPWTESTVTWNSFNNQYDDQNSWGTFTNYGGGWVSTDIKGLVENWVGGTYSSYGLLVDVLGDSAQDYKSKEYSSGQYTPYIEISYAPGSVADLSIELSASTTTPEVSSEMTFSITVSNNGADNASGVSVSSPLPSGYTYVSDNSAGDYNSSTGIWTVGAINNGSSKSITITVEVEASGNYINYCEVETSDQSDPDSTPGDNSIDEDDDDFITIVPIISVSNLKSNYDATVWEDNPTTNYGSDVALYTGKYGSGNSKALIKFDLSTIPSGAQIESVQFYVYRKTYWGTTSERDAQIYRVTSDWTESTVTWNSFNGQYDSQTSYANLSTYGGGYTNVDIKTLVEKWIDGTYTNYGLLIDLLGDSLQDFKSSEYSSGSYAPYLNITYSTPDITDLEVDISVDNVNPTIGSQVTFTVAVENVSNSDASGVTLDFSLPSGFAYSSDNANEAYNSTSGIWSVGDLVSGGSDDIEIVATVLSSGDYNSYCEIESCNQEDEDSTPGNASNTEDDDDVELVIPINCTTYEIPRLATTNDVTIWESNPNTNYESESALYAGNYNSGAAKALVKYDLSDIPENATIISANFYIYRKNSISPTSDENANVYRVTSSWEESTVTWNSFSNAYDEHNVWATFSTVGSAWTNTSVTDLIQAWVSGTHANNGLLIDISSSYAQDFKSSEYSSSYAPYLVISYESCETLPIELIEFNVEKQSGNVELNWSTASELNNDYFVIEKSVDGIDFKAIGTVDGSGNSNQLLHYSFLDQNPYSGTSYYRLMQFDYDGASSSSDIKSIHIQSGSIVGEPKIWPNPISDNWTLSFVSSTHQKVEMNMYNSQGQLVSTETLDAVEGANSIQGDLHHLSKGIYYMIIVDNTQVSKTIKIVKD